MGIAIRRARPDDLPLLVTLLTRMRAECVTQFPPVDEKRLAQQLELAAAHPRMVLFEIAELNGEAVGVVTGAAGDYAWSTERRAVGDLLFLAPDARGYSRARHLVQRLIVWARAVDAKRVLVGTTTGINPELFGNFLERLGFVRDGGLYRQELG